MAIKKISVRVEGRTSGGTHNFAVEVECDEKYLGGDRKKIAATLLNIVNQAHPDLGAKYSSLEVKSWSK